MALVSSVGSLARFHAERWIRFTSVRRVRRTFGILMRRWDFIGLMSGDVHCLPWGKLAMESQRALLDELMGAARNLTEDEKKGYKEITWDDKEVCGMYMVRFCPHDLFVNTRSDLGPCPRIHDPKLKERHVDKPVSCYFDSLASMTGGLALNIKVIPSARAPGYCRAKECITGFSFEKSPRHDSYVPRFEAELAHFCEKLVMDLDRRVRRGRERIDQEVEVPPPPPVETLNTEKTALTQQSQTGKLLMLAQEKKMALCEICGSFLIANDAAERTQSHVTGKQHIGYGMVRDFIAEHKAAKDKAHEEERLARERESEERRKQREKEYSNRGRRGDSADRDRYRDQDRERDRYRERARERESSRERIGRGNRDWKQNHYRNGRDGGRDRHRDRSRSRSPVRHGHRRSSRSPGRPY
ncbi:LUC7 N terminus domain-containing protein [Actinidia rufa]|uniref:LUC7 N terminus domain-containing protein n=1 Tax=Actinidia rufa TaxID=165716 RepID=A0A7J0E3G1_9ERIC|nr:LUC7 N terminus domain-containing protein [Actinidia rufa]